MAGEFRSLVWSCATHSVWRLRRWNKRTDAQDCLALYLQGAGASGPSATGKDGKQKLDTELRMFCEQVVDTTMIRK